MFVLTKSCNDYDQHGEYFIAAWNTKPTIKQLREIVGELAKHVLAGGGRIEWEYEWYHLVEYTPGTTYQR